MLFPRPPLADPPRRVVVTGAGLVSPLGCGWTASAEGFRNGRQAFGPVTLFDVSRQRSRIAAEVRLPEGSPESRLSRRQWLRMDRAGRMLLWAAVEAWNQSGWTAGATGLPLVLATTSGGMTLGQDFFRQAAQATPSARHQAVRVTHYQPQRQALDVMDGCGFQGPVSVVANACASGANAIGHAADLVRWGGHHRVMAGGYDALSQLVFAGFDTLQALSPTGSRPFARNRDGLTLGEGAAVVCLEEREAALRRGATILGEILGYGAATDVHHLTQPHPAGDAALATMQAACREAGIEPGAVGYVNAHGTGTPLNDAAEAQAIQRWAGGAVGQVPVSSTKALIGHLLGAAGAVETVVCLMALQGQWLPPQGPTEDPDPACTFPLVQHPQEKRLDHVLTNSFGFGGANASLLLGRGT